MIHIPNTSGFIIVQYSLFSFKRGAIILMKPSKLSSISICSTGIWPSSDISTGLLDKTITLSALVSL